MLVEAAEAEPEAILEVADMLELDDPVELLVVVVALRKETRSAIAPEATEETRNSRSGVCGSLEGVEGHVSGSRGIDRHDHPDRAVVSLRAWRQGWRTDTMRVKGGGLQYNHIGSVLLIVT